MRILSLPSSPATAAILARLHEECAVAERAWRAEDFASLLSAAGTRALLAEEDGPSGFILFRQMAGEGEILALGVRPRRRRRGAGRRLLGAALAEMGMDGARRVFLEVAVDNAAAIALYEGQNFAPVGRRKGYYGRADGSRVDALVLAFTFGEACGCEE